VDAVAFALEALDEAPDAADVEAALIRRGVDRDRAARAVADAQAEIAAAHARAVARRRPLAQAFVAGFLVAALAGAAWAWLVATAGYRLGPVAWLIGIAAGLAVVRTAKRRGRRVHVAVGCAFVGFLLGKELAFALTLHDLTHGSVGVFSLTAEKDFFGDPAASVGPGDVLPFLFALWGGWAVPRPRRRPAV
jgi:F0F1-type ATP synthase assembly protein I